MVIIGAGIAGMVLAFELRKSGYRPLILEARPRPGGRNWSLRGGDTVAETGFTQHVSWDRDQHLYFNPGRRGCRTTTRASWRIAARSACRLK